MERRFSLALSSFIFHLLLLLFAMTLRYRFLLLCLRVLCLRVLFFLH